MMSPDMRNDGHNTTLEYATKWAREFLLPLLQDKGNTLWKERTVIPLTYDEADIYEHPNRIVSLLLGPGVPPDLADTEDGSRHGAAQLESADPGPLRRRRQRVPVCG